MTLDTAWLIVFVFLLVIFLLFISIFIQRYINLKKDKKQGLARDYLFAKYFDLEDISMPFSNRFFIDAFIEIEGQVKVDPDIRLHIIDDFRKMRFMKKQFKNLHSFSVMKRKKSIFYLSIVRDDESLTHFKKRLRVETNESCIFMLIETLIDQFDQDDFNILVNHLESPSQELKRWVYAISKNHFKAIKHCVDTYFNRQDLHIVEFLLHLAKYTSDSKFRDYAKRIFQDDLLDIRIKRMAFEALASMHPEEIVKPEYCLHDDLEIKKIAIRAAGHIPQQKMVDHLLSSIDGSELDQEKTQALSRIVYDSNTFFLYVLEYYTKSKNDYQKQVISTVLSHRMDYLMVKIKDPAYRYLLNIIDDLLKRHVVEDFIDFANHNKDQIVEELIIDLIKKHIASDNYLLNQFTIYLDERILDKLGLMKKTKPFFAKEKAPFEGRKLVWIISWIIFSILVLPLVFFVTNFRTIFYSNVNVFKYMIVSFNQYLVIYFMTVNSIYALLLFLSIKGSKDQIDHWNMKKKTLLYERDLLPSISIIAPAYNEEKSIIESTTSLLNLKYPSYEVVVVNDGSKDKTIDVLIDHFMLERKHPFFKMSLPTKDLRGVYINRKIPNLIVIDKQNGGKADALNMGINVAKGTYVCGIDADSLLEEEALLKLMSITLDNPTEHIALGGNIVPVNDCIVDKGKVEHNRLGKNPLVRFQTLEYLRAFTTGRIGWSRLKSLLIISGAFGLFNRKTLLETGGYLTISGALKKDTVGEDMELVVRLTYQALRQKRKYRVEYVHHANCYTELPNQLVALLKQRNRWQRGLLDILSYHRRMLFNPFYKQPGLIAFPYFFIFEMMGPFIEFIGYMALFIGLIMGILNLPIVLVLLAATIGYGMAISLFSLFVAEKQRTYYSTKETFILALVAIIENFGYRQMMSLHRVISTFSALKDSGSWGAQVRQGFTTK